MKMTQAVYPYPGGLTLAVAPNPGMASVSLGIWIAAGGRYETAELSGASHFIEHMLFKGTRRRSAREISQAVEGIGGYLNAFTGEEHTCYFAKAPAARFREVFEVLADMLLNSRFDPAELEKEREVIKEEVAMYRDQPHHRVEELLNALQWPDQPLGRPLTGTEKTLESLDRDRLLHHHRAHYVAPSVVVAVAGQLQTSACRQAAGELSRRLRAGLPRRFLPVVIDQAQPRIRSARQRGEQAQVALGIRTCSRHDPRRHALRLLNVILGENMSSRLFQALREDTGLAYHVSSSLSFFDDTGDLVIGAGLEPGQLEKALRLALQELGRLRDTVVGRRELQMARDYVVGQMALSLENSENQMMWLGEQWLGYRRLWTPEAVRRRLKQVTALEVQAVARDFFQPSRLNLAVVSPEKTSARLPAILGRA